MKRRIFRSIAIVGAIVTLGAASTLITSASAAGPSDSGSSDALGSQITSAVVTPKSTVAIEWDASAEDCRYSTHIVYRNGEVADGGYHFTSFEDRSIDLSTSPEQYTYVVRTYCQNSSTNQITGGTEWEESEFHSEPWTAILSAPELQAPQLSAKAYQTYQVLIHWTGSQSAEKFDVYMDGKWLTTQPFPGYLSNPAPSTGWHTYKVVAHDDDQVVESQEIRIYFAGCFLDC